MNRKFYLQLFAEEKPSELETPENKEERKPEEHKEEAKYTDADIDRILGKKFAEWKEKEAKKVSEAERLSKMTAEEKANERIKQLEERLAAADKEKAVAAMTKQARAILAEKSINVNDELLANLVSDDADATKANCENFISLFNNAVEKAVKEALKGESPKGGGNPAGMTKDQILAIPNRAERQRLMKEHKNLF
jgi:tyrosyl-tRNA synthetase